MMHLAQKTSRLLPRAAVGAAIAAPLAWMAQDGQTHCESRLNNQQSTINAFGRLKSVYGEPFVNLLANAVKQDYSTGDCVFRTHDIADDKNAKFYWILAGGVEVVMPSALEGEGEVSSSLRAGDFVGDLAFIPKEKKRVRDVSTTQNSVIFAISKDAFDKALTAINPKLATASGDTLKARTLAFMEMVSPTTPMVLKKGEATKSEPALYIVKKGSIMVRTSERGREIDAAEIKEGEFYGTKALLGKGFSEDKSITVQGVSASTEIVKISSSDFHTMMSRSQMIANFMGKFA